MSLPAGGRASPSFQGVTATGIKPLQHAKVVSPRSMPTPESSSIVSTFRAETLFVRFRASLRTGTQACMHACMQAGRRAPRPPQWPSSCSCVVLPVQSFSSFLALVCLVACFFGSHEARIAGGALRRMDFDPQNSAASFACLGLFEPGLRLFARALGIFLSLPPSICCGANPSPSRERHS